MSDPINMLPAVQSTKLFVCLYSALTSESTIFLLCRDRATTACVLTSNLGSKCALLKDTTGGLNPGSLDSESDTLSLDKQCSLKECCFLKFCSRRPEYHYRKADVVRFYGNFINILGIKTCRI